MIERITLCIDAGPDALYFTAAASLICLTSEGSANYTSMSGILGANLNFSMYVHICRM